jgi:DNA-binding winged helix-turn-helix (wHTH) protein/tetratricopeptide (TPR) repeat protein
MDHKTKHLYEFGGFRLDEAERLLLRAGEPVSLTPKAFDLLLVLVKRSGRLVEKEELFKAVWPDTIVEESNLSSNIALIRKVLGDDASAPRFIETVPKRGYRFIAELQVVEGEPVPGTAIAGSLSSLPPASPELSVVEKNDGKEPESLPTGLTKARPRALLLHQNKRWLIALGIVAVFVLIAVTGIRYFNPKPVLTEKDTILLADFENRTGDAIFDGTLKQGLAVQFQQSPFLTLFPEEQVRQTLLLMDRSPDERVTAEIAREICERQGLKALIVGSIAPLGSHFVITLEAINSQNGETLARQQVQAESHEQVLQALSQTATHVHEKLGEALRSIAASQPLDQAKTSKLQALKDSTKSRELSAQGRFVEAIPFLKRAVELDPQFSDALIRLAIQYYVIGQPESAAKYAEQAYLLQDRVIELEKLDRTCWYHLFSTGNLNRSLEARTMQQQAYPTIPFVHHNLALTHNQIGQSEAAVAEAREMYRLNPNFAPVYRVFSLALVRLNLFAEAREILNQAQQRKLMATENRLRLYQISFIEGDTMEMGRQVEAMSGNPEEYAALDWQTGAATFAGQWRKAQELSRRAIELAAQVEMKEVAGRYAAEQALRGAVLGNWRQAQVDAVQALQYGHGRALLSRVALALALCGETKQAQPLVDELSKRYPEDTLINSIWLPVIRAAIGLQRGNAAQAIEQLRNTSRYEGAAEFWPQFLRGQAYLKLGRGAQAASEFQQILDHRGYAPLSVLYPLAQLGLARAVKLSGEAARAHEAYEAFFTVWKEADQDLLIWKEARQESVQAK